MNASNYSLKTIKRAIVLDQMGVKSLEISQKLKVPLPLLMKWLENSQTLLEIESDENGKEEDISECSARPMQQNKTAPESEICENIKPKKQYNRKAPAKTVDIASEISVPDKPKRKYLRKAQSQPATPDPLSEMSETCDINKPKRKYVRKTKDISATPDPQSTDIPMVTSDLSRNVKPNVEIPLVVPKRKYTRKQNPVSNVTTPEYDISANIKSQAIGSITPSVIDSNVCDTVEIQKSKKPKRQYNRKPIPPKPSPADTNLPNIVKTYGTIDDISMTSLSPISSSGECDLPVKSKDTQISLEPINSMTKNVEIPLVSNNLRLLDEKPIKQISPAKICDVSKKMDKSEKFQQPKKGKIAKVPEEGNKRYRPAGRYGKFGKPVEFGPTAGSIMPDNYIVTPFEKKARHKPISYEEKLPVLDISKRTPVKQKKVRTGLLSHEEISRRRIIFEQILNEMNSSSEEEIELGKSCDVNELVTLPYQEEVPIDSSIAEFTDEIKSNENQICEKEIEKNLDTDFETGWYRNTIKELMSSSDDEFIKSNNDKVVNMAVENDKCILNSSDTHLDEISQCQKNQVSISENDLKLLELDFNLTDSSESGLSSNTSTSSVTTTEDESQTCLIENPVSEEIQDRTFNDQAKELDSLTDNEPMSSIETAESRNSQASILNDGNIDYSLLEKDLYLSDSDDSRSLCGECTRLSDSTDEDLVSNEGCQSQDHSYIDRVADDLNSSVPSQVNDTNLNLGSGGIEIPFDDNW